MRVSGITFYVLIIDYFLSDHVLVHLLCENELILCHQNVSDKVPLVDFSRRSTVWKNKKNKERDSEISTPI